MDREKVRVWVRLSSQSDDDAEVMKLDPDSSISEFKQTLCGTGLLRIPNITSIQSVTCDGQVLGNRTQIKQQHAEKTFVITLAGGTYHTVFPKILIIFSRTS